MPSLEPLRRIEHVLQSGLLRLLHALLGRRRAAGVPDLRRPARLLVIRNDAIGDLIMTTGLLRRLREVHPAAQIDVVVSPSNAPVLEGNPHVRRVYTHRRGNALRVLRLARTLRAERYDAVLDARVLLDRVPTDPALLMLASGAPHRIGVGGRANDFIYTERVTRISYDVHYVELVARLAAPLGLDPAAGDWRPELSVSPAERAAAARLWGEAAGGGRRLLVNISAGQPRRRWPDERFAAALRHVRERAPDTRMLVLAPPWELDSARAIAAAAGATAAAPALRDAFALVPDADVVFTPDTSIAHVASAFVTPCVVMLLAGMGNFVPYRTPGRCVYAQGPTLDALPVEPVTAALDEVLARGRAMERECR